MKLVYYLLALCSLALAARLDWNELRREEVYDTNYVPQREYQYLYDGQITTGFPEGSYQQSATRIQALISLIFQRGGNTVLMRMKEIRFGSANRELPEPKEVIPFKVFEEKEITTEQEEVLRLPLRFKYTEGLVSEIEFDRDDKPWSKNMKRAVLNMLQVNINKRILKERDELEMDEDRRRKENDFFITYERTVEGDCETAYTLNTISTPKRNEMQMTKSINFEKCRERTDIRYNYRFLEPCKACEQWFKGHEHIKSSTVLTYGILGSRDKFLIKNVALLSQYVFAPLSSEDNSLTSNVVAKLQLMKVSEANRDLDEPNSERKETLLYGREADVMIERFYMNGDNELTQDHPYKEVTNKVEIVENLVRRMLHAMTDEEVGFDTEASNQMANLVDVLRMCTRQELRRIHERLCEEALFDEKTTHKIRDILVDALSLAGTKNTIEYLVEKIERREVHYVKAAKAIQNLVNVQVPSEKQVDLVLRLCKKEVCERNPLLKQSCFLTVGGMMRALCSNKEDRLAIEHRDEKKCTRQIKQKYVDKLMEWYRESNIRYNKILVLKTLANAGLDISVQELEKIIRDGEEERIVRTQAVDALRHLRKEMPRKVQKVLMPIFKDMKESPELRIAAFYQIMHTIPERPILDQLVDTLWKEQSRQVHSFVYAFLEKFSESKNYCEKKLAEDLKTSLRLARTHINRWTDSKFWRMPLYTDKFRTGITFNMATIFGKEGILPRELMASLDMLFGRQWNKYAAQLGFVQYNGEELLEELLKITKEKMKRTDTVRPQELLQELYRKLNIRERSERTDPHAMVYIRYMDLDFAILPLDTETLPEKWKFFRNGKLDFTHLQRSLMQPLRFDSHFATFVYENTRKISTSLGLPLVIYGRVPTILGLNGEIKVHIETTENERLDNVRIHIRAMPRLAAIRLFTVRTWNPIVSNGFKAIQTGKLNLPIDLVMELNLKDKTEIKYMFKVPERRTQLLNIQTRLVSVTSTWPKNSKVFVEPKMRTVHLDLLKQKTENIAKKFDEKWLGMRIEVNGHYFKHPESRIRGLLFNENVLEITVEPGRRNTREIAAAVEFDILHKDIERPQLEKFYTEDNGDEWNTWEESQEDEHDDEREEREGRRERRVNNYERKYRDEQEDREETQERRDLQLKDEKLRRDEFRQYIRNYEDLKGYGLRMRIKLHILREVTERIGEMQLETMCDERLRYCRMNVDAWRKPLFEDETREWTLKAKVQSLYPRHVRNLKELREHKHREFNAMIECEWGTDKRQFINLKIQGEQSREQLRLLENINIEERPIEHLDEIILATQLNQYRILANYRLKKLSIEFLNKVYELLKGRYTMNLEMLKRLENIREGRLYGILTIDPRSHQYVTVYLETPRETVRIDDIQLPFKVAPLMVNMYRRDTTVKSLRHFVNRITAEDRSECKVTTKRVNTFDDVDIKMPITTCYSVLAKDCSSEQPKFAVLMKKINKDSERKKMKVIDEDRVIEVEPEVEEKFRVRINDRVIKEEKRLREYNIELRDNMMIVELEDVLIRFDGYTVSLKVSGVMKERVCGLCGHYDDQKENELRLADNRFTDDVQEYHRSYLNRDEECELEEDILREKRNFGKDVDKFIDDLNNNEKETKEPIMRTKVIEYGHDVCFSTKPVPECPNDTYEGDEKTTKKISFACLRRSDSTTSRLLRRARTRVLNMENYKQSFVENINVPRECLVF